MSLERTPADAGTVAQKAAWAAYLASRRADGERARVAAGDDVLDQLVAELNSKSSQETQALFAACGEYGQGRLDRIVRRAGACDVGRDPANRTPDYTAGWNDEQREDDDRLEAIREGRK